MLGLIFFIITWIACFVFSYKVLYIISKNNGGDISGDKEEGRYWRTVFSSFHILSIGFSIYCFIEDGSYACRIKADGFIGKILKKLEK